MVIVDGQTPARSTFGPLAAEEALVLAALPELAAALGDELVVLEVLLLPQALMATATASASASSPVNRIRLCIGSLFVMCEYAIAGGNGGLS
jgi:hypothetical protein